MSTDTEQRPTTRAHREVRATHRRVWIVVAGVLAVVGALVVVSSRGGDAPDPSISDEQAFELLAVAAVVDAPAAGPPTVDLGGCTLTVLSVELGDEGESVECAQKALMAAGAYTGEITGVFDQATEDATIAVQEERELYVDGVIGGSTATSLGIWPGDETFVVRTPPPAPGATDLWGVELSSVASAGDDAPPMPENSGQGTGKRVVYDRMGQRVWAVDDDERVIRSYLVTGSQYNNELPGVHTVYSRSEMSTAWNGEARLPLMIRYLDTVRGAIGFHAIPLRISDGQPYQTEAELGQKLSGGCQRQANLDAEFLWGFATEGTTVIVT
jgi:peptidoglycan hydrolase-like protein with peptidoglycan-binding domain